MLESPGIILESTQVSNQPHTVILKHLGEKNTHLQKPETGPWRRAKKKKKKLNFTKNKYTVACLFLNYLKMQCNIIIYDQFNR